MSSSLHNSFPPFSMYLSQLCGFRVWRMTFLAISQMVNLSTSSPKSLRSSLILKSCWVTFSVVLAFIGELACQHHILLDVTGFFTKILCWLAELTSWTSFDFPLWFQLDWLLLSQWSHFNTVHCGLQGLVCQVEQEPSTCLPWKDCTNFQVEWVAFTSWWVVLLHLHNGKCQLSPWFQHHQHF